MARHLARLLGYLEARYGFQLTTPYIHTKHNVTSDTVSRESDEEVARIMRAAGFTEVNARPAWEELLEAGYARRVHALALADREDWRVAAQLWERREGGARLALEPRCLAARWEVLEVGATLRGYRNAAAALGTRAASRPPRRYSGRPPRRDARRRLEAPGRFASRRA